MWRSCQGFDKIFYFWAVEDQQELLCSCQWVVAAWVTLTPVDWQLLILFLASFSQVGCLWRSSLKVPRVTHPLSDCCSRIRGARGSCEGAKANRHACSSSTHHRSRFTLLSWSSRQLFKFNPRCLSVYMKGYFFYWCGSASVDPDMLSDRPLHECFPAPLTSYFIQQSAISY